MMASCNDISVSGATSSKVIMTSKHPQSPSASPRAISSSNGAEAAKKRRLIRTARTTARQAAAKRAESLHIASQTLRHMGEQALCLESALHHTRLRKLQELCARIDQSTATLMKAFADMQARDLRQLEHNRRVEEQRLQRIQQDQAAVHLLRLFGAHLNLETNGRVMFKQLDQSSAQFDRCVRATEENTKPTITVTDGSPLCVKVVTVFKLEHAPLLQIFQQAARSPDSGRIKGLFCHVPAESVPRLVAHGMFASTSEHEALYNMYEDQWFTLPMNPSSAELVDHTSQSRTPSSLANEQGIRGYGWARRFVEQSHPVEFPRWFSRYSTLEELSPADDELQFTALCRVLPANVHVADETMQRVQFYQRNQETVYAPQREEYMVCRASHVMPEFLIAFRVEQPEAHCTANLTAGREQNEEPSARVPGLTRSIILEQLEATFAAFWSEHAAIVQSKIEAISENYHPSPCT